MAGHSKWANIKHKKAKTDAKRGKVFTKLIRALTVAARAGGGDVGANPRLRDAVAKAKAQNMSNDTIDRAIKKGAGGLEGQNIEDIVYEGYGPGGVAVMVECMTDNRKRTVSDVRHVLTKMGGNLGTDGSVAYLFSKQGQLTFAAGTNEDQLMEQALEAGAEDIVSNDDGSFDVITSPEQFMLVKQALETAGLKADNSDLTMAASTEVPLDKDTAEKFMRMVEMLEDLDDVQEVFSNANIADKVLAELSQ